MLKALQHQYSTSAILSISYIGYKPVEIKINSQNSYNITLEEDSEALDEVVVIGYGTARKIDLTGSTASLGGDKLTNEEYTTTR